MEETSTVIRVNLYNLVLAQKTMKLYALGSSALYFGAANKCVSFVNPSLPELTYFCVLEEQLKIKVSTWCR